MIALGRVQFRVPSDNGKDSYIVDMHENIPNGLCSCWDFLSRRQKNWDANHVVVNYGRPGATRCKHINAVLLSLGEAAVKATH